MTTTDLTHLAPFLPWAGWLTAALATLVLPLYFKRRAERTVAVPTFPEIWARMDAQDKRFAAMARVVMAIGQQAPPGFHPKLDPADVEILQGDIPLKWRQPPPTTGPTPITTKGSTP